MPADVLGLQGMFLNSAEDYIFKCISLEWNIFILTEILPKFVPKSPIENESALVQVMKKQVMAWHYQSTSCMPKFS